MPQGWTPEASAVPSGWTPEVRTSAPVASGWTPESSSASSVPNDDSSAPWLAGAGALAAGAGLYAITRNPQAALTAAKKVGNMAMDVRRASMLSGLALPKSVGGAVGGAALASVERGSWAPIREMLSMETLRDAGRVYKAGPNYASTGPAASLDTGLSSVPGLKWLHPGRAMGAFDQAAQNAFVRAGFTPEEAAKEMLQAPLGKSPLIKSLSDNPIADYLVPFRRTPINQFSEGFESLKPANLKTFGQKAAMGTAVGAGALSGAEAEDPKSIAIGTALAGRRGLPFALSAGISRALTSGSKAKGAEAIQGLSPVSDYSISEGALGPFMDPTKSVIPQPAAIKAVDYLRKLLGMD